MKTLKTLLLVIAILASCTLNAQVSVTTDGSSADGSAMLDVKSTNKGFLPPRMTTTERNAISNPADGLIIYNQTTECIEFYKNSVWFFLCGSSFIDVTSPTGKIWMDRNLGASQVATSSTDANSYGDLYQWGRAADGHQIRTSETTTTLSSTDTPGHGKFITNENSPNDWRNPQNDNLWQGVSGTNNPCPSGYRLPTEAEWEAERNSWSSMDAAGAFASPLKLPLAGRRDSNGSLDYMGTYGYYWSSTVYDTFSTSRSTFLNLKDNDASMRGSVRDYGLSVRCLKD